jgi:hypothetical protein
MCKTRATDVLVGDLITISTGEYSDYSVHGVFIVRKTYNPDDLIQQFAKEKTAEYMQRHNLTADQVNNYAFDRWSVTGGDIHMAFVGWVTHPDNGWLESVDSREWYLGSYGNLVSSGGEAV